MSEREAEIRAREQAATEGPWEPDRFSNGDRTPLAMPTESHGYFLRADAEFIAHARQDIPWMLERIDTVRALHRPVDFTDEHGTTKICQHCTGPHVYGQQYYPCPTIEALDGGA